MKAARSSFPVPLWSALVPVGSLAVALFLAVLLHGPLPGLLVPVAVVLLVWTVLAAVHQAETIAHRLGDPYGAILLAFAVTIIEVALIVSVLLKAPPGTSEIARDTVFAAIMIALNGIVGLCLLVGGLRFREQEFVARGAVGSLAVLATVAVLALVLPNYTVAVPGPVYATPQLLFVAIVSFALYLVFLFVQMVRHRGDFSEPRLEEAGDARPGRSALVAALVLLPIALLAVVVLAESLAPTIEHGVASAGLPAALVGVVIAMTVLLPEGLSAVRAAGANRLQTSLNLALGSALASICLTIPAVALLSIALDQPLTLGLEAEHIVLLLLSLFVATLSLAMGRTTILQGALHLVVFGAFLTIAAMP
ncbi:ionic transporter y4hA [Wenzhouxiangella sp. XN79A]|uniref:calcium:proton antiporter n=1 Tax=Wenzhouxiangella sp. XN79A TaxID=2724193 RepID=UPI00144A4F2C|nr:ionic transporter y4hA [Wenzhouxiangella sp. XN79A]NKI36326.1 ionic transporter y4hA [Wenzhouxiangella sp. XN79A]